MVCPKCGHENPTNQKDCSRCGVIFAKARPGLAPQVPVPVPVDLEATDASPLAACFSVSAKHSPLHLWGWVLGLLILAVWGGKLIFVRIDSNAAGESLLHLVNLPFHEAGHLIFSPLGSFITSLGGTLGQLLIPLICLGTLLWKTRDPFGAAACLWWFGENFLDLAPYINDARAGELPLLGGNTGNSAPYGFHDWEYLLTETGLLRYDHLLARTSHLLGSGLMLLAVFWLGGLLYRQYQNQRPG